MALHQERIPNVVHVSTRVRGRRYQPDVDDERWSALTMYGFVRVTTDEAHGPTWEAAREDVVARMNEIDGSRNGQ